MTILYKLASSLGRRDAEPNHKLAQQIIIRMDALSVAELIDNTASKIENIQADCVEVLSEIAKYKPELIIEYDSFFIHLLGNRNRNLVLGSLAVLDYVTKWKPDSIYNNLPKILEVADSGLLISKEHGFSVLLQLILIEKYSYEVSRLILVQFKTCAIVLVIRYAEKVQELILDAYKADFVKVLELRMSEIDNNIKRDKIQKVILSCALR
jgi:hypothetical protein